MYSEKATTRLRDKALGRSDALRRHALLGRSASPVIIHHPCQSCGRCYRNDRDWCWPTLNFCCAVKRGFLVTLALFDLNFWAVGILERIGIHSQFWMICTFHFLNRRPNNIHEVQVWNAEEEQEEHWDD